jgi:hypothetical protein
MSRIEDILARSRITLSDVNKDRYSDANLLVVLDEAQKDFCEATKVLKESKYSLLSVGVSTITLPEDCWMITRAVYKNSKLPLLSYADVDFILGNSNIELDFGLTQGWESDVGSPRAIIYDKNNLGTVRLYPIPDDSILEDDFTIDTYGVVADLTYFGVLTEFSGPLGVATGLEGDNKLIKIYYVRMPDDVTELTDTLNTHKMFDKALKYYIVGQTFLNDLDAGWQAKGLQQLQFYDRDLKKAKDSEAANHNRSGEFHTNYRSSF